MVGPPLWAMTMVPTGVLLLAIIKGGKLTNPREGVENPLAPKSGMGILPMIWSHHRQQDADATFLLHGAKRSTVHPSPFRT